jgi:Fe-S cluster biogenesis protein NfuA
MQTDMPHTEDTLISQVNQALDQMRPFMAADGGDMELVGITPDMVVEVRLLGSCSSCHMSGMTLRAGVEEAVRRSVPAIRSVRAVE